jgi:hypothetical protein
MNARFFSVNFQVCNIKLNENNSTKRSAKYFTAVKF